MRNKERIKVYKIKYYQENKEFVDSQNRKYAQNNKDKVTEYKHSWYDEHREAMLKRSKNYRINNYEKDLKQRKSYYQNNKQLFRDRKRKYYQTPNGRDVINRSNEKRNRELGWEPINKWSLGAVGHHLRYTNDLNCKDNNIVVYIPKELHKSIYHDGSTGYNMALANKKFLEWYLNTTPANERNKQAIKLYWNYCTLPEPVWIKEGITSEITKL